MPPRTSRASRSLFLPGTSSASGRSRGGYLDLSSKPLHILAFVLPLVVGYEVGARVYFASPDGEPSPVLLAWSVVLGFFEAFGAAGSLLPAAAIVATLVIWHVMLRERTRVRPLVLGAMVMESVALALPLLVLGALLQQAIAGASPAAPTAAVFAAAPPGGGLMQAMPWQARLCISVGAGLYEEFLFRMLLLALLHTILVNVMRLREQVGLVIAVAAAALLFALAHNLSPDGVLDPAKAAFYIAAGLYFGMIYVVRGFGLAVGTHVFYDALVLVILPAMRA